MFSISYYFSSYKLSQESGKSPSINLLNDILLKLFFILRIFVFKMISLRSECAGLFFLVYTKKNAKSHFLELAHTVNPQPCFGRLVYGTRRNHNHRHRAVPGGSAKDANRQPCYQERVADHHPACHQRGAKEHREGCAGHTGERPPQCLQGCALVGVSFDIRRTGEHHFVTQTRSTNEISTPAKARSRPSPARWQPTPSQQRNAEIPELRGC